MDTDIADVSSQEMQLRGLINMWERGEEGAYLVQHSQKPAPDFPSHQKFSTNLVVKDNYWEMAFPTLFPYGTGGLDADRPVKINLIEHARWLLQQHDHRFRLHETFAFVVCNQQQRKDVLTSARIQMRSRDWYREAALFSSLTQGDLEKAAAEEDRGQAITDYRVIRLKQVTQACARRVLAADSTRFRYRQELRSTCTYVSPPSIWLTINPDDLHDPLVKVFFDGDINMDDFDRAAGPGKEERARNAANDPYATAKFFNFVIKLVLEKLMGTKATSKRFEFGKGVFGYVRAYYGTVECQGRGTLHLHILIFLDGAPSTDKMKEYLQSQEFRQRIVDFIKANFRAHYPELHTEEQINAMPTEPEIAFQRPPNPNDNDFWQKVRTLFLTDIIFLISIPVSRFGSTGCKNQANAYLYHLNLPHAGQIERCPLQATGALAIIPRRLCRRIREVDAEAVLWITERGCTLHTDESSLQQ